MKLFNDMRDFEPERFAEYIHLIPSPTIVLNADGDFIACNEEFEITSGIDRALLKLHGLHHYLNDELNWKKFMLDLDSGHHHYPYLELLHANSKQLIYLRFVSKKISQNDHQYFLINFFNVTNEILNLKDLQDKAELFESINENLDETVIRSNPEGIIYCNNAGLKLFGYSDLNEMRESGMGSFYKDDSERERLIEAMRNTGEVRAMQIELKRKNDEIFWAHFTTKKKKDRKGDLYNDTTIKDISIQVANSEKIKALSKSRELLLDVSLKYLNISLDNVSDELNNSLGDLAKFAQACCAHIVEINRFRDLIHVSNQWHDEGAINVKINYQLEKFLDNATPHKTNSTFKVVVIEDFESLDDDIKDYFVSQKINGAVFVRSDKANEFYGWVSFYFSNTSYKIDAECIDIILLFAEIVESVKSRSKKEMDLKELLSRTTSQNQILKEYSFITSHNLRSNTANLLGLVEMLELYPDRNQLIEHLKTSCQRLNDTIASVNQMINLEEAMDNLVINDCCVHELVTRVVSDNITRIQDLSADIELDIDDNLFVIAYEPLLESVINNLLTNALKYGVTDESKKIKVTAHVDNSMNQINLEFQDFGRGINLDKYGHKLFQMGSRLHQDIKDGQGLGLYMTKRHVEYMGGTINVSSKENYGAKFNIYLNEAK